MKTLLLFSSLGLSLFLSVFSYGQNVVLHGPIRIMPENLLEGADVVFEATLEAQGANSGPVHVTGAIDGKVIYSQTISNLNQQPKQLLRFTWKAVAGSHKVVFSQKGTESAQNAPASPRSFAARKDPDANPLTIEKEFTVNPIAVQTIRPVTAVAMVAVQPECNDKPLADLIVTVSDGVSGTGKVGETVSITVTVSNVGQCATGQSKLRLYVNTSDAGDLVGEVNVPGLQPQRDGAAYSTYSFSHSFNYTPNQEATYQFHAVINEDNSVDEFRRYNNDSYGGSFTSRLR